MTQTYTPCTAPVSVGIFNEAGFTGGFGLDSNFNFSDYTLTSGVLGTLDIDISIGSTPTTIQAAIYTTNASGYPLALVAASAKQVFSASGGSGFRTFAMPAVAFPAGTYAVGFWTVGGNTNGELQNGNGFYLANVAGGDLTNVPTGGLESSASSLMILYVTYCPIGEGPQTSTPTPTPTITNTPTVTNTPTFTLTPCAAPVSFGPTTTDNTYPPANSDSVYFADYTATSSGTLRTIYYYMASGPTLPCDVQVALYTVDGSGYPLNLVSVSAIQTVQTATTTGGFIPFVMPTAPVVSGTQYAFCMWLRDGVGLSIGTVSGGSGLGVAMFQGSGLDTPPTQGEFIPASEGPSAYAEICP